MWLVATYTKFLQSNPFKTVMATTGTLSCFGDLIAQQLVERRGWKHHQPRRTIKLTLMGIVLIAPTLRIWYMTLDKLVKGATVTSAAKKMLLDQGLFAPFFIFNFFIISDALDGKSGDEIKNKMKNSYLNTLKVNWTVWPAVQILNFYFMPLNYRVLTANLVALFWNTYLSWAVNKEQKVIQQVLR